MKQNLKRVPVRLGRPEYKELRERVLRRDGWRCQICGCMKNLEIHHQQLRSRSGPDLENNLMTMCSNCHGLIHSRGLQGEK